MCSNPLADVARRRFGALAILSLLPIAAVAGIAAATDIAPPTAAITDSGERMPARAPGLTVNLDRDSSLRGRLDLTVPFAADGQPQRELTLRPSSEARPGDHQAALDVAPAGLRLNYRSTFVPWLETLALLNADVGGYAGSPGLHSRWSSEIDQWVAMLDSPGFPSRF